MDLNDDSHMFKYLTILGYYTPERFTCINCRYLQLETHYDPTYIIFLPNRFIRVRIRPDRLGWPGAEQTPASQQLLVLFVVAAMERMD